MERRQMITVALTGSVAAGKSTVAAIWEQAGIPVVRADELAREAVAPGSKGLKEVVEAFGPEILLADGSLDRAALRDRVFRDGGARTRLEGILHPRIGSLRERWMDLQREEGSALAVAEIPLLFEVGLEGDFDVVVCVDAPEELRLERLVEDRGLEEADARRIMAAQMPSGEKRRRAHFVLDNGGTREELREKSMALLDVLRTRAHATKTVRRDGGGTS
jgi:dephospho-CoA kinase